MLGIPVISRVAQMWEPPKCVALAEKKLSPEVDHFPAFQLPSRESLPVEGAGTQCAGLSSPYRRPCLAAPSRFQ
eukprot:9281771-Pyramimonas_sp.AAC.1